MPHPEPQKNSFDRATRFFNINWQTTAAIATIIAIIGGGVGYFFDSNSAQAKVDSSQDSKIAVLQQSVIDASVLQASTNKSVRDINAIVTQILINEGGNPERVINKLPQ